MIHWGVVATGVFTLLAVYWQHFSVAALEGSDFILHAKFAYRMIQEGQFTTPHFIYHLALVGVAELFGASFYAASMSIAIASNLCVLDASSGISTHRTLSVWPGVYD